MYLQWLYVPFQKHFFSFHHNQAYFKKGLLSLFLQSCLLFTPLLSKLWLLILLFNWKYLGKDHQGLLMTFKFPPFKNSLLLGFLILLLTLGFQVFSLSLYSFPNYSCISRFCSQHPFFLILYSLSGEVSLKPMAQLSSTNLYNVQKTFKGKKFS